MPIKNISCHKIRKRIIRQRDQYTCIYCGASSNLSLDHIIPLSKGGGKINIHNIVTSCVPCNALRSNTSIEEWVDIIAEEQKINAKLLFLKIHFRQYFSREWIKNNPIKKVSFDLHEQIKCIKERKPFIKKLKKKIARSIYAY